MIKRYMDTANRGHIEWPTGEWVKHEDAAALESKIAELQSALDVQSARSDALAAKLNDVCAENAALKSVIGECQRYFIAGIRNAIRPTNEGYLHMRCDTVADETPATDAWVNEQRAVGVDGAIEKLITMLNHQSTGVSASINVLRTFAAQLRGGRV
ncbi:hypothetical protein [Atlantibacter hermannii]|uniref:hypothetical protein n=1 Tax=Atlantibacter hermannii TaxID=565 RepID=UPI00289BCB54|nr:hypothetical protein [Atlantibacter hermannii]